MGDAAHVIHPIAGQGLNMGLRDVAALAEAVADAARLGLDPGARGGAGALPALAALDNMAMGVATDGFNRLFSNHSDVLRLARDVGLGVVDRMPALKRMFIREAAGFAGDVPKLLQGRGAVMLLSSRRREREIRARHRRVGKVPRRRGVPPLRRGGRRITKRHAADVILEGLPRRDRRIPAVEIRRRRSARHQLPDSGSP